MKKEGKVKESRRDIAEVLQELPPIKRGIILGYAAAMAVETKKEKKGA